MSSYLQKLITKRDSLLNDLLSDAGGTMDNYNIDGQSVTRSRWRQWALDALMTLNQLIQQEDPYEIRTTVL
jgi:hypothetical protein